MYDVTATRNPVRVMVSMAEKDFVFQIINLSPL